MEHGGSPDFIWHGSPMRSRITGSSPKLKQGLHQAVLASGLARHRQPAVHCPANLLHGSRALARWDKPGASLASPATRFADAAGLHREPDPRLPRRALAGPARARAAVNVSAFWFRRGGPSRAVPTPGAAGPLQ